MRKHLKYQGSDIFLIPSMRRGVLLYAPLLKKLFRISWQLAECVSQSNFRQDGVQSGLDFLLKSLEKSIETIVSPRQPFSGDLFHLSLELTRNCSLNCGYCHAMAGKEESMAEDILDVAIDYAFEQSKQRQAALNVSYVAGGEPTYEWDLFARSIKKIRFAQKREGVPTNISITTNGYYGERRREFLVKNLDSVLLSFDGPRHIQDEQRPTTDGRGSYDLVIESARFFHDHAKSFAVRSTITKKSVCFMSEIVRFFYEKVGDNLDIVFEPCFPVGRAEGSDKTPVQKAYVESYIKAKKVAKELGVKVVSSAESAATRLTTSYCGAISLPSFVVTTDGRITACEGDAEGKEYWFGKLNGGRLVLDERRLELLRGLTETPQKCTSCFAKFHCAGDCPTTRMVGYDHCFINRGLIQYHLEELV